MYGLFLRALQGQVCTTFSPDTWGRAIIRAGLASDRFEPLLPYDAAMFRRVLSAVAAELGRGQEVILEDVGTWIITGAQHDAVRRLLRFGGTTFPDFLLSLEELADRAHLALPDISLPPLILEEALPGEYRLSASGEAAGLIHVLLGMLRAMADDYGALVLIEALPACGDRATLAITLLEAGFAEGRRFDLRPSAVPGSALSGGAGRPVAVRDGMAG